MKKLLLLFIAVLTVAISRAQAPDKISYQAVIRDASNNLIINSPVTVRISLLKNSFAGEPVYVSTYSTNTNSNGLISLEIGSGDVESGDFASIDWSGADYFIKTETDPSGGSDYSIVGTSQLLSVPYSMYSKTAGNIANDLVDDADADPRNEIQVLSIIGNSIYLSDGGSVELPSAVIGFSGKYEDLTNVPADISDGDDNTQLSESEVDAFVGNNGYLTTEVDGSITNEIELPTGGNDGQVLKTDGLGNYAWVDQTELDAVPVWKSFTNGGAYADNDIVNYNGILYRHLTTANSDLTPNADATNWILLNLGVDAVPLWKSFTNGGVYADKDIVNYNGILYRHLTTANSDLTPNADATNWILLNLGVDAVPLWKSFTNGGVYADNDIVNYNGILYRHLTTANSDLTPNADATNWILLNLGVDAVPLWKSFTNGGVYADNDIVNYNGILYKHLTTANSDLTPDADATNWILLNLGVDAVPLWKSFTNGGAYADNDIVNYNGILYRHLTTANSDLTPNADATNWILLNLGVDAVPLWKSFTNGGVYADNDIVNYNGILYKHLTTANSDLTPDADATNWILLNLGVDAVPLWESLTNGGAYADNDIVNYNGILYKHITTSNTDTDPSADATNWILLNPEVDAVPLWKSLTNGGAYADNDIVNYNGILYKHITTANTDTDPSADATNWTLLNPGVDAVPLWKSFTNGGVYADNDIVNYNGILYKHLTTANSDLTPDADATNWILLNLGVDAVPLWKSFTNGGAYADNDIVNYNGILYRHLTTANSDLTPDADATNWILLNLGVDAVPLWKSFTNGGAYADNDIVNYNGILYKHITTANTDTDPSADATNWTLLNPEVDAVPLWESNTNGGAYADNDIVNYNGILYKHITTANTDTDPSADATNWTLLNPGVDAVPLWESLTNGGAYADNDIVNYNGILYKHITTANTDTDPSADATNWTLLNPGVDAVPLWESLTNGGAYADNDIVNYNGILYKHITTANTDTDPSADATNWTLLNPGVDAVPLWESLTNGGAYADNDIVNYNGILYKHITTGNTDTDPSADATNWTLLNPGVDAVPLWESNTNGGDYADNDIVNYNGILYKHITTTNTDTDPSADATNWTLLNPEVDAVPLWESLTNGGAYADNDIVNYNGILYKHITTGNTDTDPSADATNWTLLNPGVDAVPLWESLTNGGAYADNDIVNYNGILYKHITTGNTDTDPSADATNWTLLNPGVDAVPLWESLTNGGAYADNDIVNYNGILYKHITTGNTDTDPSADATNWTLLNPGVDAVPLWESNTNGGDYADNDIVNYNGILYKHITTTNTDTDPSADATNWTLLNPEVDAVPLWESLTNGGAYADNDIVNYNGILYKHITTGNTDTDPSADATNWTLLNPGVDAVPLWESLTNGGAYADNDIVNYNGILYKHITTGNTDTDPSADATNWTLLNPGVDAVPLWESLTNGGAYADNDIVNYNGILYKHITTGNTDTDPSADATNWTLLNPGVDAVPLWESLTNGGAYADNDIVNYNGILYKHITTANTDTDPSADATNWTLLNPEVDAVPLWESLTNGGAYADNDIVNYNGILYKHITTANTDTDPSADATNWTLLNPGVDAVPLWESLTNGGAYADNDIVNYNGILYKHITTANTDTDPSADATNWILLNPEVDAVPLWESLTNGGAYADNDIVNYNGILYKHITTANTDTDPSADATNWTLLNPEVDAVPLWESNTNGGAYADNDIVNYNGILYKHITTANTDNDPSADATNWTLLNPGVDAVPLWKSLTNGGAYADNDIVNYNGILYKHITTTNTDTDPSADATNWTLLNPEVDAVPLWESNTNGGVYADNDIVNYNGILYKHITTANSDLTPDADATNWILLNPGVDAVPLWESLTNGGAYADNDIVNYNGILYKHITTANTDTDPSADATNWTLLNPEVDAVPLWESLTNGGAYADNDIVNYNGILYKHITTTNTDTDPSADATNWTLLNPEVDAVPLWESLTTGGAYADNDIVNYNGILYKHITTTNTDTDPSADATNWTLLNPGVDAVPLWESLTNGGAYADNDIVNYNGILYKHITTTNTDTDPSADATNWTLLNPEVDAVPLWESLTNGGAYADNDIVNYNGILYKHITTTNTDTDPSADATNWTLLNPGVDAVPLWESLTNGGAYADNDIVNYNGILYKHITTANTDTDPSADATNWTLLNPEVDAVPLWESLTNGGAYADNDIVNYNGILYKHITTTNSDLTPDADATNWILLNPEVDAVPLWESLTNGGAYADNDIVNYNGILYKHITTANTDTDPSADATNWILLNPGVDAVPLWESLTNGGAYADNDIVNYNGILYKHITTANSDLTPDADATNWTLLNPEVDAVPLWESLTNGGAYADNDIVNYNGILYKHITTANTDTDPSADATNWTLLNPGVDAVPLWESLTNGGAYADNDIVNYNGILYKHITTANTDTDPSADATNWILLNPEVDAVPLWESLTNGGAYADNDIVNYNGILYKHITTTNSDLTPDADATNWILLNPEVDAVPLWESLTNGGAYADNDIVNYNGILYKHITTTNTDTDPSADATNWTLLNPGVDAVPLWESLTNGGAYADNDIVNYNGILYKHITTTNSDLTPDADATNWTLLNPGVDAVPLWESLTNGGAYADNDIVNYNGILYKHITTANTDTDPSADATNWTLLNPGVDAIPLWESLTNGGAYADNDIVNYNGILYKHITTSNTDTDPSADATNWTLLNPGVDAIPLWESLTNGGAYADNDIVNYNGILYKHITTSNTDTDPSADATNWTLLNPGVDAVPLWESLTNGGAYADNDIVNYNGILYKHITTTNSDLTPDADATNWTLLNPGVDAVPLWESLTNGGAYADNDIVNYNGILYKHITTANTDTDPSADATNWTLLNPEVDAVPLWESLTNGGAYADNDIVNYNGILYKHITTTNTDTNPSADATNWTLLNPEVDAVPLWESLTNGGAYADNDIVNYNGILYKHITTTNTDTDPSADATNWTLLNPEVDAVPLWESLTNGGAYADNDIVNYNGILYRHLTTANSDLTPDADATNWILLNPGVDAVPLWESLTNGGAYADNDIVNYNGILYKHITTANTDTDPSADATNWTLLNPRVDAVPLWESLTNGGAYADNDIVNYNGILYKHITTTNTDTDPSADATNWILLNPEVDAVPLWESNTNGGVYADNDIVNYNGILYKHITTTNTDTNPSADATNWTLLNPEVDAVPLWESNTNGGVYADNDIVNYNGILYKHITTTNTDTNPSADATNWILLNPEIDAVPLWESLTNGGVYADNDIVNYNGILYKHIATANTDTDPNMDLTNWALLNPEVDAVPLWESLTNGGAYDIDDIVNYSGVLYKHLTTVNSNISPNADLINWILLNPEVDAVPLWESLTNGGVYADNDIVNYNGILYKHITTSNTDTDPSADATNWILLNPEVDAVPLWESNTNGGVYADNDIVNYNGILYKHITTTNTDTDPSADATNWTLLNPEVDAVPLWESNTNGGDYSVDDIVNYLGELYKHLTSNNSDTAPNSDVTNWALLSPEADIVPLWKSDTDGGDYQINDIINYMGSFHKNITGVNTDDDPIADGTNWESVKGAVVNVEEPNYLMSNKPSSWDASFIITWEVASSKGITGTKEFTITKNGLYKVDVYLREGNTDDTYPTARVLINGVVKAQNDARISGVNEYNTMATGWVGTLEVGDVITIYGRNNHVVNQVYGGTLNIFELSAASSGVISNESEANGSVLPYLKVYRNVNANITASTTSTPTHLSDLFNKVELDNTNSWSSGIYTAPEDGRYQVEVGIRTNDDTSGNPTSFTNLYVSKNDNNSYTDALVSIYSLSVSRVHSIIGSIDLEAGNTLRIKNTYGTTTSTPINIGSYMIIRKLPPNEGLGVTQNLSSTNEYLTGDKFKGKLVYKRYVEGTTPNGIVDILFGGVDVLISVTGRVERVGTNQTHDINTIMATSAGGGANFSAIFLDTVTDQVQILINNNVSADYVGEQYWAIIEYTKN